MFKIYNSLGKKMADFRPANKDVVTLFTCGPSVYQRAHIGNFRTFLFEDVLVRYLEYSGYRVRRGLNFTDIEDKAIVESEKRHLSVAQITDENIKVFLGEMKLLGMKIPDYLPKASDHVAEAVEIIERLLAKGIAYWHGRNVYFDPLRSPGFGKIYGLDMTKWPRKKRRFHKDTYPGIQWNRGDFILWHGYKERDKIFWETKIGKGRPSWNIQDASMVGSQFHETLSIYCGGIDNLYRHHDYSRAILESIRPYPMALYWLHCHHLYVQGKKMSKSKGNILYTETLMEKGYSAKEVRFFLIYNHYRSRLDYREERMEAAAGKLRDLRQRVRRISHWAGPAEAGAGRTSREIVKAFQEKMDADLDVRAACDGLYTAVSGIIPAQLGKEEAAGIVQTLRGIDSVLKVIF